MSVEIGTVTVQYRNLNPQEFAMLAPLLVDIYLEAMEYCPQIREDRVAVWRREVRHPGFAAVIAEQGGAIIGVAYGFLGNPDTWWDRQLRRGCAEQGEMNERQWDILRNYFELAEIHVRPSAQGQGIGRVLLTELMKLTWAKYALLSTPEVEGEANLAFGLYRSLGFWDVLRDYVYPGDNRRFAVLGVNLPLGSQQGGTPKGRL